MQGKADFEVRQEIVGKPTLSIVIASHSHPALAGWLGCEPPNLGNRFNGFVGGGKTVKTVNERPILRARHPAKAGCE